MAFAALGGAGLWHGSRRVWGSALREGTMRMRAEEFTLQNLLLHGLVVEVPLAQRALSLQQSDLHPLLV